jgi:hypothetical protein
MSAATKLPSEKTKSKIQFLSETIQPCEQKRNRPTKHHHSDGGDLSHAPINQTAKQSDRNSL